MKGQAIVNEIRTRLLTIVACCATLAACGSPAQTPPPSKSVGVESVANCPTFVDASKGLPVEGEWKTFPAVGDVNGDGLADIAVIPRKANGPHVFLSDGVGGWNDSSKEIQYGNEISCGIGMRIRDINLDGAPDLLVADHCQGILVFYGDKTGHWKPGSEGIPRNIQGFNDAEAGDIDGDGRIDIVGVSAFSSGFLVLAGQPDGSWRVRTDSGLPESGNGWSVHLKDFDLDGRLDILTSFQPSSMDRRVVPPPPAKVWLQGADSHFKPTEGFPEEGRFFGLIAWKNPARRIPSVIAALSGAWGGLWMFESEDAQRWGKGVRLDHGGFAEEGAMFVGIDLADMDGDGCDDIVTTEGGSGKAWLAMGDCKGAWKFCPESTLPLDQSLPPWGVRAGDFNGDGRLDVGAAFGKGNLGAVKTWIQTNRAKPSGAGS